MINLLKELIFKSEKSSKFKLFRSKTTVERNSLKEEDTIKFVNCLKDIVLTAIYSKTHFNDAIKTFQYLCFLRNDIMLPPLLDQIYRSFEVLIEPHRYTSMLACLVSVPRELSIYSKDARFSNHSIVQLLISILPGIDINDLNKFILTNQLLSNVLGCIAVCDCSSAINIRNDLTDYEKELCLLTAKFEDFILELLKKVFEFVDHLANDTSSESSASASQAAYSLNNHDVTEENVTQVHVIQMLKVLVTQSSKKILKLIVRKLKEFMQDKNFDNRSGDIIASVCGFLVVSVIFFF